MNLERLFENKMYGLCEMAASVSRIVSFDKLTSHTHVYGHTIFSRDDSLFGDVRPGVSTVDFSPHCITFVKLPNISIVAS